MEQSGAKRNILQVRNVTFQVPTKAGPRKILDNISFTMWSGQTLAMMGPSGAGKTTLLECLTMSLKGKATGQVLFNKRPFSFDVFQAHAALVEQYDNHRAFLTCRETLQYAAQMCIVDRAEGRNQVDIILKKLGLVECADTRAGNMFIKGISGGQKKRLSLGLNLLKNPKVLFLDEPTSGLDAASAENVMTYLQSSAVELNMIVICTIHQPATKIFMAFSNVLFMSRGRPAYFGPPAESTSYCDTIGHPVPDLTNPADYFMELINSDFMGEEETTKILDAWLQKDTGTPAESTEEPPVLEVRKPPSAVSRCCTLLRRDFILSLRDPSLYLGRVVACLISEAFFAFVYIKQRDRTQQYVRVKLFLLAWTVGPTTMFSLVNVYACNEEFKKTKKDIKNGISAVSSYLVSGTLLQLPYMLLLSLGTLLLPIYVIGNFDFGGFPKAILLFTLIFWSFEALSDLMAVIADQPIVGMFFHLNLWFTAFLFLGLFLSPDQIIWPIRAMCYALPLRWALRAFAYIEFTSGGTWSKAEWVQGAGTRTLLCEDPAYCFGVTGKEVLSTLTDFFGVVSPDDTVVLDMILVFGIGLVFKLAYVVVVVMKCRSVNTIEPAKA